jgi:hypothetical protein
MRSSAGRATTTVLWSAMALGLVAGIVGVALQLWFNPVDAVNRERKQIAAQATDFSAAYATYDAADLSGYEKRVEGLMTDDFRKAFERKAKLAFAGLAQAKWVQGDPRVRGVGVSDIDSKDKSAFALVAVDYTVTIKGADQAIEFYDRWLLSMSKVGDEWQVGGYKSLMGGAQEAVSLPGAAK